MGKSKFFIYLIVFVTFMFGSSYSSSQYKLPPISSKYYTPGWSFDDPIGISGMGSASNQKYRIVSGDRNYVVSATSAQDGAPVVIKKIVDEMPLDPQHQLWYVYRTNTMGGGGIALASSDIHGASNLLYLTYDSGRDLWVLSKNAASSSLTIDYNPLNGARRIYYKGLSMGIQYSTDNDDAVFTADDGKYLDIGWNLMYHLYFVLDPGPVNSTNDTPFDNSAYYNEDLYVNPTLVSGTRFRLVTPDLKYVILPFCSTLDFDTMDRTPISPVQITSGRRPNPLEIFVFDGVTNYTLQEPSNYVYKPNGPWGVLTINPNPSDTRLGLFDLTLQMDSFVLNDLSSPKPHNPSIGVPVKLIPVQEGYFALCSDTNSGKCYAYSRNTNIIYLKQFSDCDSEIRWLPLEATDAASLRSC